VFGEEGGREESGKDGKGEGGNSIPFALL